MVFGGVMVQWQLTYRVDPAQLLSGRNMKKLQRETNKKVLNYWHKVMLDKHFTPKGFSEYRYQRRTRATVHYKKKHFGHNDPIKQKGIAEILTGHIKNSRATPTKASITMDGPWYMGHRQKRKDGKLSPDLKDELTRVSHADAMKLAYMGGEYMREKIKEAKKSKIGARVFKP